IRLPSGARLVGVPGETRIVYGGDGYLLAAEDAGAIVLEGLSIDGANRGLGAEAQALVEMRRVASFMMDRCEIVGSGGTAVATEPTAASWSVAGRPAATAPSSPATASSASRRAAAAPARTATASTSSAPATSSSPTITSPTAPSRPSAPTAPATCRSSPTSAC